MTQTIESFVAKLQAEGVQAGQQEARKIVDQARSQADRIVAEAKAQAQKIVEDADNQAQTRLAKGRTELELASRDAVLKLQDALQQALSAVLAKGVGEALKDGDFLCKLLHDLVMAYAQADMEHRTIRINVAQEISSCVAHWALKEMTSKAGAAGVSIELKTALHKAGFEYSINNATVEVTQDSVVATLLEMVSPALREILSQAAQSK